MKALMPVLDNTRKKPYYLQLYDYIKEAILRGDITEDEKLPSLRSLAKSTELSITTIEQCYNQLLVEGYIYSKAQSGYYVSKVFPHSNKNFPLNKDSFPLQQPDTVSTSAKGNTSMYFDPESFTLGKWKKCMNKVINEFPEMLYFESDPQGEPALRSEIAKYLYTYRGVICKPEQIIIGAGTQQLTNLLATMLKNLSIEHVSLENPGYTPVRNIFRDRGFAITSVDVKNDGLVIERLPANIRTAVYTSPSNHVFTGSVMPAGRRYQLINWAVENNSYIIEDDYDSELRYFGKPIPALRSLKNSNKVIYLGSFSSTLFAAVKISYMVMPDDMSKAISSLVQDYSQTCSKLEQLTLAMFMETGHYQTHIKKLRKLYGQKLTALTEAFAKEASDFIDVKNTSSGLSVTLKVHSNLENDQLKKEAEDIGIPLIPLYEKGLVALYYNQIPLDSISEAVSELIAKWR